MAALGRRVAALVVPATAFYALEGSAYLIPVLAASHYGADGAEDAEARVGAVGLGSTVLTCVALVARSGWASGQDAVVPQAVGKRDFPAARASLRACMAWMSALALACAAVLAGADAALVRLGLADAAAAELSGRFVRACLPGLWFDFQYDALRKFLLNHERPGPSLAATALALPLQFLCSRELLRHGERDAMQALGLAWSLRAAASFLLLAAYTSFCAPFQSCRGWWRFWAGGACSSEALLDYARHGLASTAMYGADWWAWEMLTFMASGLKDGPELAAHVAAAGASDWLFMLMRGCPKAATVLIGEAYGRADAAAVRAALRACAACSAATCLSVVAALWTCRGRIAPWVLPGEGPAQTALAALLPFVLVQLVLDAANSLSESALAGFGHQGPTSLVLFFSNWLVQLPMAWALAHSFGWGVQGLRAAGCAAGALSLALNAALLRGCLAAMPRAPPRAVAPPPPGPAGHAGGYGALRRRTEPPV